MIITPKLQGAVSHNVTFLGYLNRLHQYCLWKLPDRFYRDSNNILGVSRRGKRLEYLLVIKILI